MQQQFRGLGGVQNRHYDRHSTMEEERKAPELWEGRLGEPKCDTALRKALIGIGNPSKWYRAPFKTLHYNRFSC